MNILFDIGGTVLGIIDNSLRPGVKELIEDLRGKGHLVAFWTVGSPRQIEEYRRVLRENGIEGEIYNKLRPLPFKPDLCIDDSDSQGPARTIIVDPYLGKDWEATRIKIDIS